MGNSWSEWQRKTSGTVFVATAILLPKQTAQTQFNRNLPTYCKLLKANWISKMHDHIFIAEMGRVRGTCMPENLREFALSFCLVSPRE